jgi:hypothetical protein
MISERTLILIIRILEECLENDYSAEELRDKIRDMLKLINNGLYSDFQFESL